MIYDENFLKQLHCQQNRVTHARVTALNLQELPLQAIEGYVTQGSINIDGASAVRRTCSLTIVAREDKFQFSDYYWGFNTKFKLEIGLENTINSNYPDIIWFPQGVFIITTFSVSRSINNLTITLQGKDKMCLLNGEVGGNVESSVDFGKLEEIDQDGHKVFHKIPIPEIIRNLLIHYGHEQYHNIIINDLDEYGLELLEYRGIKPLYLIRRGSDNMDTFYTATYQGDMPCQILKPNDLFDESVNTESLTLDTLNDNIWGTTYDSLSEGLLGKSSMIANVVDFNNSIADYENDFETEPYHVVRIKYGQTVGFRTTELVFAGDLIANIGESLTSVLDKIKNMLGEFEYFYDVQGRFVFQQKPSVYNRNWISSYEAGVGVVAHNEEKEEQFLQKLAQSKSNVYNLGAMELITAFNNTPAIGNIKNDFSIWGQGTAITGGNMAIHLRYAIDKKPLRYTTITVEENNQELLNYNQKYGVSVTPQKSVLFIASDKTDIIQTASGQLIAVYCDWRELIYRMAKDYNKYNFLTDFRQRLIDANADDELYTNGITHYEQYYRDIEGFWRNLYNPNYLISGNYTLYDLLQQDFVGKKDYKFYEETNEGILYPKENYYLPQKNVSGIEINPQFNYWNKSIVEAPETINFWFDLLETQGELNQYSIEAIGRRTKVINDTNIKAIFYEDTPTVIFVNDIRKYEALSSSDYSYIQIPNELELFSISSRGQSAFDKLDALLYQHTYCTETASITILPIYNLQPNTRIHIEDSVSGISGDYIATKFSIQLSHNGTMAITATKAIDNIN